MNDEKYIDELVRKFFDVDITTEEMDYLYSYFLSLTTIPPKWKYDAPIIRAFAIMRYCKTTEAEFRQSLKAARQTAETRKRFAPKLVLRIAAAAACVAAIAIGFWAVSTDAVPTMPTTEVLQPILVAQAEAPAATPQTTAQQAARPTPQHTVAKAEASVADGQNTAADVPTHNRTDHDAAVPNTDTVATIYDEPANTPNYRYLAYADIQSYKTDTREYFCSSDCTGEYMVQAVCEMINCI